MVLPFIMKLLADAAIGAVISEASNPMPSGRGGISGKAGLNIVWTTDTITPRLRSAAPRAHAYLHSLTQSYSLRAETYAKSNAPWMDRTGNARSGLGAVGDSAQRGNVAVYGIDVHHRVPYGIWLETKHGGRNAIIARTVDTQGRAFFKSAEAAMSRMFR